MKNAAAPICAIAVAYAVFLPMSVFAQTSPSTTCPEILLPPAVGVTNTLTSGEVSALQGFLSQTGTSSPLAITGHFGTQTSQALRQFQVSQGLSSTGTLTASTSAAIEASCLSNVSVSFNTPNLLSLSATPSISGFILNLSTPLMVSLTSQQDGTLAYKDAVVPIINDSWTITTPVLPVGSYLVTLSTQGISLATSTLAVGIPSIPTVLSEEASLPVSDIADGRLMRFAIHAGEESDVAVGQVTFTIATDSADVSAVELYAYSDPEYSIPATTSPAGNLVNDSPVDPSSGEFTIIPDTPLVIPSGETYFFELDASVIPSDTSYWVTTSLLGDSFVGSADTFANLQASGTHFIWSPEVFGESATTTADWVNGSVTSGLADGLVETRTSTSTTPSPALVPTITASPAVSTSSNANTTSATASSTTLAATSSAPSTPSGQFTAKPTSGPIPLTVIFAGSVNASKSCLASTFSLYFGDGASTSIPVAAKKCATVTFSISHRYTKTGVFIAALYSINTSSSTKLVQSQTITAGTIKKIALSSDPYLAAVLSAASSEWHSFLQWITQY